MRHMITAALALAVLAGGSYWFTSWATNTCQPLDRLWGASGCVDTLEVANFSPLFRDTMSPVGADGQASLIGWQLEQNEGWSGPVLVRIDLDSRREIERFPLPMAQEFDHAVFSADGQRALLSCTTKRDCAEGGSAAAIISTVDGTQLGLVDEWEAFPRIFPGDPRPDVTFTPFAMVASQGRTVIEQDDAQNLVLIEPDDGRVVTLATREERSDVFAPRLVISPDQSRVALMSSFPGRKVVGDGFRIWDGLTGAEIASVTASLDYAISSNAAWSWDNAAIFNIRKSNGNVLIDKFVISPQVQ